MIAIFTFTSFAAYQLKRMAVLSHIQNIQNIALYQQHRLLESLKRVAFHLSLDNKACMVTNIGDDMATRYHRKWWHENGCSYWYENTKYYYMFMLISKSDCVQFPDLSYAAIAYFQLIMTTDFDTIIAGNVARKIQVSMPCHGKRVTLTPGLLNYYYL